MEAHHKGLILGLIWFVLIVGSGAALSFELEDLALFGTAAAPWVAAIGVALAFLAWQTQLRELQTALREAKEAKEFLQGQRDALQAQVNLAARSARLSAQSEKLRLLTQIVADANDPNFKLKQANALAEGIVAASIKRSAGHDAIIRQTTKTVDDVRRAIESMPGFIDLSAKLEVHSQTSGSLSVGSSVESDESSEQT